MFNQVEDFGAEWDAKMDANAENANAILLKGERIALDLLLDKIRLFELTRIHQVTEMIEKSIQELDDLNADSVSSTSDHEKSMLADQYEVDANLDHITENQF